MRMRQVVIEGRGLLKIVISVALYTTLRKNALINIQILISITSVLCKVIVA